jgi:hypothetical protein
MANRQFNHGPTIMGIGLIVLTIGLLAGARGAAAVAVIVISCAACLGGFLYCVLGSRNPTS